MEFPGEDYNKGGTLTCEEDILEGLSDIITYFDQSRFSEGADPFIICALGCGPSGNYCLVKSILEQIRSRTKSLEIEIHLNDLSNVNEAAENISRLEESMNPISIKKSRKNYFEEIIEEKRVDLFLAIETICYIWNPPKSPNLIGFSPEVNAGKEDWEQAALESLEHFYIVRSREMRDGGVLVVNHTQFSDEHTEDDMKTYRLIRACEEALTQITKSYGGEWVPHPSVTRTLSSMQAPLFSSKLIVLSATLHRLQSSIARSFYAGGCDIQQLAEYYAQDILGICMQQFSDLALQTAITPQNVIHIKLQFITFVATHLIRTLQDIPQTMALSLLILGKQSI